jgi:hypothetical protein
MVCVLPPPNEVCSPMTGRDPDLRQPPPVLLDLDFEPVEPVAA